MATAITLSAGVRQNLLALQTTQSLMSDTQNRLATGKKVNSALDNPGNFFTSNSLNNRAGDLNSLLDSIGQAQQVLKAADSGLTSLSKLVESAKSIAKQAQQAPQAGSTTYNAFSVSGNPTDEALATVAGGTITVTSAATYAFTININGTGATTISYVSDATPTLGEIVTNLNTQVDAAAVAAGFTAADIAVVTNGGGDGITINALNADIDFVIGVNSAAGLSNGTYNSTSLLDNIGTTASTLTVQVNGGVNQIISFGSGASDVSTLAELATKIGTLTGVTGAASNGGVNLNVASHTSQNSLELTHSFAGLATALGLADGTTQGTATIGSANATRTSLEADYNNVLAQIDALNKDASYNGVNLLNGDDLKVTFNETSTSSLTITGVTFNANGLGLAAVGSGTFQADGNLDTEIAKLDSALSTIRTQASKFGSNLTTVQTRQEFTKALIDTLRTGADNLVLADTNQEGANLLALQTRQQLSTTALALSAQADQAVLRLF
jgi:flagellin-like hook-associated protein FlgL